MRSIKFRAWDKKDELMYYDIQKGIDFDDGSHYRFNDFLEKRKDDYHDWCVMQFTGLKDKNGKEIYEGDIARHYKLGDFDKKEPIVGEVVIEASRGVVIGGWPFGFQENTEVIGNVWETPELLTNLSRKGE